MILLDTNAVIYLLAGHARSRALVRYAGRLAVSPVSVLELCLLTEVGRLRFMGGTPADTVRTDPRWTLDDPPLDAVVARAEGLSWTRDPFDRLVVAHGLARGWRIATSDLSMLKNLPAAATLAL